LDVLQGKNGSRSISLINKILLTTNVTYFLYSHDIVQIEGFPILEETVSSLIKNGSYQVRYCKNDEGEHVAIPESFQSCPFQDTTIYYEKDLIK